MLSITKILLNDKSNRNALNVGHERKSWKSGSRSSEQITGRHDCLGSEIAEVTPSGAYYLYDGVGYDCTGHKIFVVRPNGTDANLNLSASSMRGATDCIGSNCLEIKYNE